MAFSSDNLDDVIQALRDSEAIDPVVVCNKPGHIFGRYSATSELNVTDERIIATRLSLEEWCSKSPDEITDDDCAEFAQILRDACMVEEGEV